MIWTDFARRGVPWAELIIERGARADALNLGWRNRLSALAAILIPTGALRRRIAPVAAGIAALVVLNADLYRLLLKRRGPIHAVAAVPLHVIHLATAILAVPAALGRRLLKRLGRWGRQGEAPQAGRAARRYVEGHSHAAGDSRASRSRSRRPRRDAP
jgi:hypothetical protein